MSMFYISVVIMTKLASIVDRPRLYLSLYIKDIGVRSEEGRISTFVGEGGREDFVFREGRKKGRISTFVGEGFDFREGRQDFK